MPIQSVEDLLVRGVNEGMSWGLLNNSIIETYLDEAPEPKFADLISQAERHQPPYSEDVFKSIVQDDHALIEWKTTLDLIMKEQYTKTGLCDYALGIEEFFTERVAIAFPPSNPWIMKFDAV